MRVVEQVISPELRQVLYSDLIHSYKLYALYLRNGLYGFAAERASDYNSILKVLGGASKNKGHIYLSMGYNFNKKH